MKSDEEKMKDAQNDIPQGVKETKQIKTTVRNMSELYNEKLMQIKDLASLEVLLPTSVRMKKRLQSIKDMSSAYSIKVRGNWKTTAPEMHIMGLEGRKINNDEAEISFSIFETDKKGNKKLHTHYTEIELNNGNKVTRATSAEYRVAFEVTEKIKNGKPITREIVRMDTEEVKQDDE